MRSTAASVYIRPATGDSGYLPEGPRSMLLARREVLTWVNIQNGTDSTSGTISARHLAESLDDVRVPCPARPGFALPMAGGDRLLVGLDKELRICNLVEGEWSEPLAAIPDANPRTIINDAQIVPGGRAIVFGTKDTLFKEPIANLYLYTVDDNQVSLLADRQTCSNGKVFAKDRRGLSLYDIDTPTRKVVRYRLDVAARKATLDGVAIELADQIGFPDGMCDCGDGSVIIAFYNPDFVTAGKAIRFDLATGKGLEEWTTPGSPRVTCPLLMKRPEGVQLILTTAIEGMSAEMRAACPNAGSLFLADTTLTECPDPEVVQLLR